MPTSTRYSAVAIVLHWLMAALILTNIVLALTVNYLPDNRVEMVIDTHKSLGITLMGLLIMRVLWRIANRPPAWPPDAIPPLELRIAQFLQWALYALLLAIPLSGWLYVSAWSTANNRPMTLFGLIPWPGISWVSGLQPGMQEHWHAILGEAHEILATALYILVALHVFGALKLQWLDRRRALRRMWL